MAFVAPLLAAAAVGGGAAAAGASAATALTIGTTVLGGLGAMQSANYQAAVARNNYQTSLQNAQAASTASQTEAMRSDLQYAELYGQQEAIQGASGLDVLGVSQLATRQTTGRTAASARRDIYSQGQAKTTGFKGDAQQAQIERNAARASSQMALAGTVLGVGTAVSKDTKLSKSLLGAARSIRRRF